MHYCTRTFVIRKHSDFQCIMLLKYRHIIKTHPKQLVEEKVNYILKDWNIVVSIKKLFESFFE